MADESLNKALEAAKSKKKEESKEPAKKRGRKKKQESTGVVEAKQEQVRKGFDLEARREAREKELQARQQEEHNKKSALREKYIHLIEPIEQAIGQKASLKLEIDGTATLSRSDGMNICINLLGANVNNLVDTARRFAR